MEKDLLFEPDDFSVDGDDEDEVDQTISAIAPVVTLQEVLNSEVTSSPAFQILEELYEAGKINRSQKAKLKAKYKKLHEQLIIVRESEGCLVEEAKMFTLFLEQQQAQLQEAESFPDSPENEAGRLRQEYLKKMNEMAKIEDRETNLRFQLESLSEELRLINLEFARAPKAEKIESERKKLEAEIDELKKENAQKNIELKNLKEELETKVKQKEVIEKDLEEKEEIFNHLKTDLVCINSQPVQIQKEIDKINRNKNEIEAQMKEKIDLTLDLNNEIKKMNARYKILEIDRNEIAKDLELNRNQLKGKEYEFNNLQRNYEYEKERETMLLSDRATLDLSLRHLDVEKKSGHDQLTRKRREIERDHRQLKKMEGQQESAQDSLRHLETIYKRTLEQSKQYPKENPLIEKRKQLQEEVDEIKKTHAQQTVLTSVEQVKVEDLILVEERLNKQQEDLRNTVVDFHRLTQIKADEREQKSRDFVRAEQRYQKSLNEMRAKELSLMDHTKRVNQTQLHLKEFAKLYNTIKNERNKCVNQIQACSQKSSEMKEKVRILANEIEILRNSVISHDKDLQRAKLRMLTSLVARDTLRNEECKALEYEKVLNSEREQLKLEIGRLNMLNNQSEEKMVELRKNYEDAVQHRNDRGVQLVEREEEVCIFYEKINVQDAMLKNGEIRNNELDDEIKFLELKKKEGNRQLDLCRKNIPKIKNLNDELATLQIQLSQCHDRRRALETKVEDSSNPERVRMLGGSDPTPAELQKILENLEILLADKEEKVLEKDLVFEQSTRLADRIHKKVETGKNDSLILAKKVNNYQSKTKEVTRKMMSYVSELSMKQAETMKLQQQVKNMEAIVSQSYINLQQGEPPNDEILEEWNKYIKRKLQQKSKNKEKEMEAFEDYELEDGTTTTAVPRPNAYIPDEGKLPLPKPYGALAPFKPSENGSSMRHIRKPVLKPIEI